MSYTAKSIAFVFYLNKQENIAEMQSQMIAFLNHVESDDLIYVRNPSGQPFAKPMKVVPLLGNYRLGESLAFLIRDALEAIADQDRDKTIYVLTDWKMRFDSIYELNKIINICWKNDVRVVFYETEAFYNDLDAKLTYFGNTSLAEFGSLITEDYLKKWK